VIQLIILFLAFYKIVEHQKKVLEAYKRIKIYFNKKYFMILSDSEIKKRLKSGEI
jgi:hypothetical protein